jgi:hypothetical protein
LTAFSQTVTDTNYIKLPIPIARQITLDLVDGDRAKVELISTKDLLNLTEQSSNMKDNVIGSYETKVGLYEKQISIYGEKEKTYILNIKEIESKNKRLKIENKLIKRTGLTALLAISALFIILK